MRIGIAADHGGFELKREIIEALIRNGHSVEDLGAFSLDKSDDYPDYVEPLALAISQGNLDRGIAVCGSGVGACIVANKVEGVRACLVSETYSAHQGVEHDDMNLLCLGGRVVGRELAFEIVQAFVSARFSGAERHRRRLEKVLAVERRRHSQS